ncbi:hypothetical protein NP284_06580 [Rhodopseudomonas pseudopalustris]|uniref:hypothetical protein n=1 Tax=Rhodopseudomonas pseudopalustris TaxID=1513892 RepID=UPI003F95D90B
METVIDLWHRFNGRTMSRRAGYLIATAVAFETNLPQLIVQGGFKIAGVDLTIQDTPHWVSVIFVGFAVVLLFGDRFLPENSRAEPNPHDIELYAKFRKLFDDDVMYFLRTNDFGGGSFSAKYFDVFDEISASWVEARYNFDDTDMSEIWGELFVVNRKLVRLIAENTSPTNGGDRCRPHWVSAGFFSENIRECVTEMNSTATRLAEYVDKLEVEARKKWIGTPRRPVLPIT